MPALMRSGDLSAPTLLASCAALVPALAGMSIGQRVRGRIGQQAFRRAFFGGLLLLGGYLTARGLI
jgi:uncharacterized membrane protein YfcA